MESINHPKHYNQHPNGIECIDVIRHYTCDIANALKYLWRAGLKPELGKADADKEIEDLKKALWYIEDYQKHINKRSMYTTATATEIAKKKGITDKDVCLCQVDVETGHNIKDIIDGYEENISEAMYYLLQVGIISGGGVIFMPRTWRNMLDKATSAIQRRILDIGAGQVNKELDDTLSVLHGQAIDGEDYVSKPGCERETEPEQYDPLNMIVVWGKAYSLTDVVRKKDNGVPRLPCESCDLWSECHEWQGMPHDMLEESKCHYLCVRLHQAESNEYYREVGAARYNPHFGTVEIVDEMKESELELKRLKEEMESEDSELSD